MADVVLNLVWGGRMGVQHYNLAAPIVEDATLTRMPAVGIVAITKLDMVHLREFGCGAVHCGASSYSVLNAPVKTTFQQELFTEDAVCLQSADLLYGSEQIMHHVDSVCCLRHQLPV
jgi:hypothetical protein